MFNKLMVKTVGGGVDVYIPIFLTLALVGGERLALSPWGKNPQYPLDRRL
jgi:hypothetical protein